MNEDFLEELVSRLVELIKSSSYIVAFTGAGVSAESGIPTFRGRDGLWRRYDPTKLATPEAFMEDPKRVWEWYKWRMEVIAKAKPNPAHIVLAKMEEKGLVKTIITQNVDGLHQKAGARNVIELHGNIWRVKCINNECGYRTTIAKPPEQLPPRCPKCGSLLRPDVVWFGEPLPRRAWEQAVGEASRADLIIVIGTSGVVQPAAMIPLIVKRRGGRIVDINVEETAYKDIADLFIKARAGEVFKLLGRKLGLID